MPINSILSWISKKRVHQIELFKQYPSEVQHDEFKKLIEAGSETEWGRLHDFKNIKTEQDYRDRVPVVDYEDIKPLIMRVKKGEQNLLWPTPVNWFAKSSGTTNDKSKFIPVSKEALEKCHFRGGKDLIALYYHNNPKGRLYSGKSLVVGGSSQVNYFREDSYLGDLSSIIIKNLPFWVEFRRTPHSSIALMSEWEEKIDKMARVTSKQDVTNIAGVPSWTLIILKRILEITGASNIREVWPNLELFMHGGVNFDPYRDQFNELIPGDMHYMNSYNASEGFFGVQDQLSGSDMLLMLDYGIYYEFMPMDEVGKEHPQTLSLKDVEPNQNYALVISTNSGLWRYLIGDTIKFSSVKPFRFEITGRTKHFINAFGEELIIDNAEKGLKIACERTNAVVREYTAGPIFMTEEHPGGHEWLIEFEKAPDNLEFFTEVLDNALKSLNSDYEAKRSGNLSIAIPKVHVLENGTFYHWLKHKGKLGGQHKVPRLSNNRTHIDELLKVCKPEVVQL